jgi:hypothetical protein
MVCAAVGDMRGRAIERVGRAIAEATRMIKTFAGPRANTPNALRVMSTYVQYHDGIIITVEDVCMPTS